MSSLESPSGGLPFVEAFSPWRALERGWLALKISPFPILLGAVILVAADFGGESHFDIDEGERLRQLWRLIGLAVLAGGFVALVLFVLRVFVLPGYLRTLVSATQGRRPADNLFGELFSASDRFLPMLLWTLLHAAIRFVCVCTLLLPLVPFGLLGIFADPSALKVAVLLMAIGYCLLIVVPVFLYIDLGLFFADYRVAIDQRGPIEALKDSWKMASGNRLWLLLFRIVMWIVGALGLFAFLIGYFATRSIADGGTVSAYLSYTRGNLWEDASSTPVAPPLPPAPAAPPTAPTPPAPPAPPTAPTPPAPAASASSSPPAWAPSSPPASSSSPHVDEPPREDVP